MVYLVWPARMARSAASLAWSGVSKSGSPAPSTITGRPSRFSRCATAPIFRISETPIALMRCAGRKVDAGAWTVTAEPQLRAAIAITSIRKAGSASSTLPQARVGVLPGTTQAS